MKIIRDIDSLIEEIKSLFYDASTIITVDGFEHSGKSSVGRKLSSALNLEYIKLDSEKYRIDKGEYIKGYDLPRLQSDFIKFSSAQRNILFDGISILEILSQININPDIKIYVKRLKRYVSNNEREFWPDKDYLYNTDGIRNTSYSKDRLIDEIVKYHCKHNPDVTADYIFENVQSSSSHYLTKL